MSFPKEQPFPLKDIEIDAELDDGTLFFTYCHDCKKVLYCATSDNPITKHVAEVSIHEHREFFDYRHKVLIIPR